MTSTDATSWLTGVVLGAAAFMPTPASPPSGLKLKGEIPSTSGNYQIFGTKTGDPIARADEFNLWICLIKDTGQYGFMKIASDPKHNIAISNEAYILGEMQKFATHDYGNFFPRLVDNFTSGDRRRVLILAYPEVISDLRQFSPISKYIGEGKRVDLKTATWVLGKTLKVLDFAHRNRFTNGQINASNILIEENLHGVFIFNWLHGQNYENVPPAVAKSEIAQAARTVIAFAGGDQNAALDPPHDEKILSSENYQEYVRYLARLASGQAINALSEHSDLYRMANRFWPPQPIPGGTDTKRDFHQFTKYAR